MRLVLDSVLDGWLEDRLDELLLTLEDTEDDRDEPDALLVRVEVAPLVLERLLDCDTPEDVLEAFEMLAEDESWEAELDS